MTAQDCEASYQYIMYFEGDNVFELKRILR